MHEDYYASKPESRCGPWIDMNTFVVPVSYNVPHRERLTEDEKRSISDSLRRRGHSTDVRKKIAKSLKGKRKSKKHRQAIAAAMKGKQPSELTRAKMARSAATRNFRIVTNPS